LVRDWRTEDIGKTKMFIKSTSCRTLWIGSAHLPSGLARTMDHQDRLLFIA
jgi:hypothetical protein